jgi:hypothetical protein
MNFSFQLMLFIQFVVEVEAAITSCMIFYVCVFIDIILL